MTSQRQHGRTTDAVTRLLPPYRPPLGRLWDELHRAMPGRVASATIRALLGKVSAALARLELESQPGVITDLTTRPAAEPIT